MILYLHGFASTGEGGKWGILRDAFPGVDVQSPTLPDDPIDCMEFVADLLSNADEPHVVIGTSLGGFYAYHIASMLNVPAIIINPSMEPWLGLEEAVGTVERFDTDGETFEWTQQHIENLKVLAMQSARAPGELIHFFLARDDELLDHTGIPDEYPEAASIRWFEDGGHRFERFAELVPAIREIFASRKRLWGE
ncbi:esterase YqiA [bacterium BMS3Bbin04]|nr:esterase YqiA [bacterium BMS3Bbin04]